MGKKNKPFVQMDRTEFEHSFVEIGLPILKAILSEPFEVCMVYVSHRGVPRHAVVEYGDGEGVSSARDFMRECITAGLAVADDLRLYRVSLPTSRAVDTVADLPEWGCD